jgi:hypothetical protein
MSALIGALRVSLSADTASFEQGMARARRSAATNATAIQKSFGALKASVAGFASALTVGALVAAGKASLEYASHLGELADTLGLTTKDLQTFSFAAGQVGISQEELETGIQKLTISMGKAQLGSKAQADAFKAIGISIDELKGKNAGDVFRLIADRLEKVSDRSQRAAIEVALFGKAGAKLDNLLSGSQGRLNELSDAAERLGIVLSDDQIQKADQTADKIRALQTVLKAQIAGAVADNADSILALAHALSVLIGTIGESLKGWRILVAEFKAGVSAIGNLQNPFAAASAARKQIGFQDALSRINAGTASFIKKPRPTGASIGQFLGGGGGGGKANHSAEDAERKRVELLRKANDFLQEQFRAEQDILQAKKDLSTDYSEQTTLEVQLLDSERAAYKAQLEYEVASKDKTKAQADSLLAQYDIADSLKRQKLIADEQERAQRDGAMLASHDLDRKREILESQENLATTQSERRKIELELLKIAYEQKRQALQDTIDHSKDEAAKEDARRDLANLNTTYGNDRQAVMNQTAGPLESYINELPTTADKWNEALQNVAVDGLKSVEDGLLDILDGTKSVAEAFSDMARSIIRDLLKIAIRRFITAPLAKALFGGFSEGGMVDGFAVGGFVSGPGSPTSDSIPAMLSNGEFVVNAKATKNFLPLLTAINENQISRMATGGLPIHRHHLGQRLGIGNGNHSGASAFIFNNYAQMSQRQARETGMQAAAGFRAEMARSASKGFG